MFMHSLLYLVAQMTQPAIHLNKNVERRINRMPMTGLDILDRDHINILRQFNKLMNNEIQEKDFTMFTWQILDYISRHFKMEESLMKDMDYPGYKSHHLDHVSLKNLALVFIKPNLRIIEDKTQIMQECSKVMYHHIKTHDCLLANYIKDNGLTHA